MFCGPSNGLLGVSRRTGGMMTGLGTGAGVVDDEGFGVMVGKLGTTVGAVGNTVGVGVGLGVWIGGDGAGFVLLPAWAVVLKPIANGKSSQIDLVHIGFVLPSVGLGFAVSFAHLINQRDFVKQESAALSSQFHPANRSGMGDFDGG